MVIFKNFHASSFIFRKKHIGKLQYSTVQYWKVTEHLTVHCSMFMMSLITDRGDSCIFTRDMTMPFETLTEFKPLHHK